MYDTIIFIPKTGEGIAIATEEEALIIKENVINNGQYCWILYLKKEM